MILAIESSCDDSSVAIMKASDFSLVHYEKISQEKEHAKYGGVVPELAARLHTAALPAVILRAKEHFSALKAIAVTNEPGLSVSLLPGIVAAKALSAALNLPLISVNHLVGHIYSLFLNEQIKLPLGVLLVSGGHTMILDISETGVISVLGATSDDSFGESFDKSAKMLGLGYPGGPQIQNLALKGDDRAYDFSLPLKGTKRLEYSFSGLKNQVRLACLELENSRISSENSRIHSEIPNENSKIPSENSRIPKYTPRTPHKTILALGSELKNTFGIYYKGNIFLSPYIGDLKNIATKNRFDALLATFKRTYELEFTEIIADLHPHFSHTKDFESQNLKKLAHHKAHIYSVMCENNLPLNADILGFAFDGTGYGEDSKIWGGEVFGVCESKGLKRLYHFDNFAMIGSQNAIKNIYFLAFALLRKYELSAPSFFGRFNQNQLKRLEIGLKAASVQTSSLGRIFDAVASIVLGLDSVSYDAQAPMELEALYDSSLDVCYEFSVSGEIISLEAVLKSILAESLPSVAATGFINGIAALIAKIAKKHEKSVVLGGGCFANKALLEQTITLLKAQNTPYYLPKNLPAGDESIALGQLYYALKDENE